ncbi:MAG: hypothetical protein CL604_02520 [Alteromonadaceae bacterium]|nr:hypothetical protein [Alteromonadaceae bacterium]
MSAVFPGLLPFLSSLFGGSHGWPSIAQGALFVILMLIMALLGIVIGAWLGGARRSISSKRSLKNQH